MANTLVSKNVMGIGIYTLSPDVPTFGFLANKIILEAGKNIVENVANLKKMPIIGALCAHFANKVVQA